VESVLAGDRWTFMAGGCGGKKRALSIKHEKGKRSTSIAWTRCSRKGKTNPKFKSAGNASRKRNGYRFRDRGEKQCLGEGPDTLFAKEKQPIVAGCRWGLRTSGKRALFSGWNGKDDREDAKATGRSDNMALEYIQFSRWEREYLLSKETGEGTADQSAFEKRRDCAGSAKGCRWLLVKKKKEKRVRVILRERRYRGRGVRAPVAARRRTSTPYRMVEKHWPGSGEISRPNLGGKALGRETNWYPGSLIQW